MLENWGGGGGRIICFSLSIDVYLNGVKVKITLGEGGLIECVVHKFDILFLLCNFFIVDALIMFRTKTP